MDGKAGVPVPGDGPTAGRGLIAPPHTQPPRGVLQHAPLAPARKRLVDCAVDAMLPVAQTEFMARPRVSAALKFHDSCE